MIKWIGLIVLSLFLQGVAWGQLINAKSATGQVTALKGNMLTIKENNRELAVGLTEETQIVQGSDLKTAGDIHVGDEIMAVYREKGIQKTAVVITILTSKK